MDFRTTRHAARLIRADWVNRLRQIARDAGLEYDPVPLRGWINGTQLIAAVRSLGGDVAPVEPFHGWRLSPRFDGDQGLAAEFAPEFLKENLAVGDFVGGFLIELDGTRFVGLRTEDEHLPTPSSAATMLGGPSLEATLALASRIKAACESFDATRIRAFGTALRPIDEIGVEANDLILPDALKRTLLDYLDGFWKSAELCQRLRIAPSRGILLVGAPGTGKTLTVRHLLRRYRECARFVYMQEQHDGNDTNGAAFRIMVEQVSRTHRPAVVVIEDVDHIVDSRCVTPEFLLNVLDGLFKPDCPVLWIATSNDPSGLEDNVLDRPGRFDRVFVFPRPTEKERGRLVTRYSPWPVDSAVVEDVARRSDGLTGAHIREVCYSAAVSAAARPADYPAALRIELERVFEQHQRSRNYHSAIKAERNVGFGTKRDAYD